MAHRMYLDEKYRQLLKAELGFRYLKEGLAPFCDDVAKQQYKDIIDNIKQTKDLPTVTCGKCSWRTLEPDHERTGDKRCPLNQAKCNCCYTSGIIPCPNNVCGAIYDNIITNHASTPPAPYWDNTQTEQWTEDPWSIAKCFINVPGYEQESSAADIDCLGLLHVIINNKYFHNHIGCKITGTDVFSKVRRYRNEMLHSSTMELEDVNTYIDDMIAMLQDGKELIHRKDAQDAVKKLENLKNEFIITTQVEADVVHTAMQSVRDTINVPSTEVVETYSRKKIDNVHTTEYGEGLGTALTASVLQLEKFIMTPHVESWIDSYMPEQSVKDTIGKIRNELEEKRENVPSTEVVEIKSREKLDKVPTIEYDEGLETKLAASKKKVKEPEVVLSAQRDQHKIIKSKLGSSLKSIHWDDAVRQRDSTGIESLLESGCLPNRKQLMSACEVFSMQSKIVENITDEICKKILLTNSSKILKVWAGYRHGRENDIVFVVVTKEENADINLAFDYDLVKRGQTEFSIENRDVIYQENEQKDLFKNKNMMLDVQKCINENIGNLTKEHSNITIISGSSLKSRGFKKSKHETINRTCIVLYVHIKGIIPIKEREFPKTLIFENSKTYDTDVREGYVDLNAGGPPNEEHTNVKMGCTIGGMDKDLGWGTLGGFLEHPRYGLCGLTCAHVLVGTNEGVTEFGDMDFPCYQPNIGNSGAPARRFGDLRLAKFYQGDYNPSRTGLDYALVKIDTTRRPVNGEFPYASNNEWRSAGFDEPMMYTSGEVFGYEQVQDHRRHTVIKYGAKTRVTCGSLAWWGTALLRNGRVILFNQIQVNHICPNAFSKHGDSGSLVFLLDERNNPTAIGLLIGGFADLGCSFITPITKILDDINTQSMMNFEKVA